MKSAAIIALGMILTLLAGRVSAWAQAIQPDELISIPVETKPDQTVRLRPGVTSTNSRTDGCGVGVRFVNANRETLRALETALVPGRAWVFDLSSEDLHSEATTIQAIVDFPPDPCQVIVTPSLEVFDSDSGQSAFALDASYFVTSRWAETCDLPTEESRGI